MNKQYEYKVEYKFDEDAKQVMAEIPELNHISSFGKNFAEAEANIKEAVECYIEALVKDKKDIPKPAFSTEGTYLKLFMPQAL